LWRYNTAKPAITSDRRTYSRWHKRPQKVAHKFDAAGISCLADKFYGAVVRLFARPHGSSCGVSLCIRWCLHRCSVTGDCCAHISCGEVSCVTATHRDTAVVACHTVELQCREERLVPRARRRFIARGARHSVGRQHIRAITYHRFTTRPCRYKVPTLRASIHDCPSISP
jgi:hypothetical protein